MDDGVERFLGGLAAKVDERHQANVRAAERQQRFLIAGLVVVVGFLGWLSIELRMIASGQAEYNQKLLGLMHRLEQHVLDDGKHAETP